MNRSERFWDRKAEAYAKSAISDEASYQKKLAETRSFFSKDMRVLEVGCGTGATAVSHAPYVEHIDAIDISENMLAIARERAITAGHSNIQFTHATLSQFKAASASLDVVLALSVLHLLPNRNSVLAEVTRILKPGGVFVSGTACLGDSYLKHIRLITPLAKLFRLLPDVYVIKQAQMIAEIENAGFTIERQWQHGLNDLSLFAIAVKR